MYVLVLFYSFIYLKIDGDEKQQLVGKNRWMYKSIETTGRWTVEERPLEGTQLISGATLTVQFGVSGREKND